MTKEKVHIAPGAVVEDGRLEEEVSLEILRTAASLEHFLAEQLKAYDLTMKQYNVLRILRGAGQNGLCRNEVRARMIAPVPDATRLIDRLITAAMCRRTRTRTINGLSQPELRKVDSICYKAWTNPF